MEDKKIYICHTGGAVGADSTFEFYAKQYGVKTIVYSFLGHKTNSKLRMMLSDSDLRIGYDYIVNMNGEYLKRNLDKNYSNDYVKNLLARDYYQALHADTIFAVAEINKNTIQGGTAYAIGCAMKMQKPIYVFEKNEHQWYIYEYNMKKFIKYYDTPLLTLDFAGIGSRNIDTECILAIRSLYENLLKN